MSQNVFVYTMNRGTRSGSWSRYIFPFVVEDYAYLGDDLYLRAGDTVYLVEPDSVYDSGIGFEAIIWWPYLDFGSPGVNKMVIGFDCVIDGEFDVQFGYNQATREGYTTKVRIPDDNVPGQIIPMPINSPAMAVKITVPGGQDWRYYNFMLYLQDNRRTA